MAYSLNINDDFKCFIAENMNEDVTKLRLKKYDRPDFDVKFAILQIECLNKIKKKLPEIFKANLFIFPTLLSTEQCTAEAIAKFHASLFESYENVLDMTAGLCVDSFYISKRVKRVTSIEISPEIAQIAQYNMQCNCRNVDVINCDSIKYLETTDSQFNTIFVDPARRGDNNKRLFGIKDCFPNIIPLLPVIASKSKRLIIKVSPMMDITQALKELPFVSDIYVISIKNECKELLFILDFQDKRHEIIYHAINFRDENLAEILKVPSCNNNGLIKYGKPMVNTYLYEPNSSIMKAALFNAISQKYEVLKLHPNTHLFFSSRFISEFPGRKFEICEIIPFKDREIKNFKNRYSQINVSVRNFKLTADNLKKKLKIKDGGDKYLFGVTDESNNALILICNKLG